MAISVSMPSGKLIALIRAADPSGRLHLKVLDDRRLALFSEWVALQAVIDLGSESIQKGVADEPLATRPTPFGPRVVEIDFHAERTSGPCHAEFDSVRIPARSQKELLIRSFMYLEDAFPGTLERLSHVKRRTKRIVSETVGELYERPHLSRYATRILDRWWVATNNKSDEVRDWIRIAARLAGVDQPVQFG